MRYRSMGKLDFRPSALGFGCMRLPILNNDSTLIDETLAISLIRKAIDLGVNYVDSSYLYHGGNSERLLGKALADGYRAKVKIATKLPVKELKKQADADRCFEEQLERLGVDHIDFYLLHSLDRGRWQIAKNLRLVEWAERRRAMGHIGHFGFSFHADLDCFRDILRSHHGWDFCQVQYNFIDIEYQAGAAGVKEAADLGLGVVVMEPLRGGLLAQIPPEPVQKVWMKAANTRTPADWALQWLWNQPEVSFLLSGMNAMQQVLENVASAEASGVASLTKEELALIDEARNAYDALRPINCTACEYCLPCPQGVQIPHHFSAYNDANLFGTWRRQRRLYSRLKDKDKASVCIACGECLSRCPQHLPVPDLLAKVHRDLSEEPAGD